MDNTPPESPLHDFWAAGFSPPPGIPAAFGGDLTPGFLRDAYRVGLFPTPATDPDVAMEYANLHGDDIDRGQVKLLAGPDPFWLPWWSPDPRPVLDLAHLRLDRGALATLRKCGRWNTTANRCHARVVRECSAGRRGWLTAELAGSFQGLHEQGWAHSVEVWDGDELVAGVFGVGTTHVFSADSMFRRRDNASKVALLDLLLRLHESRTHLVDVQWESPHLTRLGARLIPRSDFLAALPPAGPVALAGGAREVGDLAGLLAAAYPRTR